jgi:hypothetical protein
VIPLIRKNFPFSGQTNKQVVPVNIIPIIIPLD